LGVDPAGGLVERVRIEREQVFAAVHAAADQAGLLQHLDVLGDRVQRHGEGRGHIGHARLAGRQPVEDRAPRGVAERLQGIVEQYIHPNG
jgi:hypothetical protein